MVCYAQPAREPGTRSGHGRRQTGKATSDGSRSPGRTNAGTVSRLQQAGPPFYPSEYSLPVRSCWGPEYVLGALLSDTALFPSHIPVKQTLGFLHGSWPGFEEAALLHPYQELAHSLEQAKPIRLACRCLAVVRELKWLTGMNWP
jgi:hypothetical protein